MPLQDDPSVTAALGRRLYIEAGEGDGWACGVRENGDIKIVCNAQTRPHVFQQDFAFELVRKLNKQISNGGTWTVGWCDGWGKLIILWLDQDGDVQFTVEDDEPVNVILEAGADHFLSQCFDAYGKWRWSMSILDLQDGETYKRAQGERRPSAK